MLHPIDNRDYSTGAHRHQPAEACTEPGADEAYAPRYRWRVLAAYIAVLVLVWLIVWGVS